MVSPTCIILALLLSGVNDYWASYVSGLYFQDRLRWGQTEYEYRICQIIPLFGREAHHETAWCILYINNALYHPSPSDGLFPYFPCFVFLNDSTFYLILSWVEHFYFMPNDFPPHSNCKGYAQGSFGTFSFLIFLHLHIPWFFQVEWTSVDIQHLGVFISYYYYSDNLIIDFVQQWMSLYLLCCSGNSDFWHASLGQQI